MHITAGLYGNNVVNGNQTACRQDIMPDTAVEVLVDRRFGWRFETPTPLRNAHGCGYIVLAVPTRLMNQGVNFARNVLVKTCWLTPFVVTVNDLVGGFATIHGRSMQPTLNPSSSTSNDLVLVDKLSIRLFKYSRGDVVLFRYLIRHFCHVQVCSACMHVTSAWCRSPVCPDTVLIKRLVALEGDWVALPERVDIEKIPQVSVV